MKSLSDDYEIILWLIPHEYGLRVRDGEWLLRQQPSQSLSPLPKQKIITYIKTPNYHLISTTRLNEGEIVYCVDTDRLYMTADNKLIKIEPADARCIKEILENV